MQYFSFLTSDCYKQEDSTKRSYAIPHWPRRLPNESGLWSFYQKVSDVLHNIMLFSGFMSFITMKFYFMFLSENCVGVLEGVSRHTRNVLRNEIL